MNREPAGAHERQIRCIHVTTVHPRHDTRILYRECKTLSEAGFDVTLLVADGRGDAHVDRISIQDIGRSPGGRIVRVSWTNLRMLWRLLRTTGGVFHFHDPELVFCATILRWRGATVVFDVHENITQQIRNKQYIPAPFRSLLALGARLADKMIGRCHGVVLAENSYRPIYERARAETTTVLNLPRRDHFARFEKTDRSDLPNGILYVGGVSTARGMDVLADALTELDRRGVAFTMHVVGREHGAIRWPEYRHGNVVSYGFLPIEEAYAISDQCRVGVSILQPIPNYLESYSTKIFEYMCIGLPFVTSDFPIYRDVADDSHAGICVDPTDAHAVADAIEKIFTSDALAAEMARNGVSATQARWNWQKEGDKLIALYRSLTKANPSSP